MFMCFASVCMCTITIAYIQCHACILNTHNIIVFAETLGKSNIRKLSNADRDMKKWKKVFLVNTMSSEESDDGDEEVIKVHPLPCCSDRVITFLHSLEDGETLPSWLCNSV